MVTMVMVIMVMVFYGFYGYNGYITITITNHAFLDNHHNHGYLWLFFGINYLELWILENFEQNNSIILLQ